MSRIEIDTVKADGILQERLMDMLEASGVVVENQAVELVPVDTGNLKNSITHNVEYPSVIIGTNTEYAPYIEFGTGVYAEDGEGRKTPWTYKRADGKFIRTSGNKPQPFLRPALSLSIDRIREIFQAR